MPYEVQRYLCTYAAAIDLLIDMQAYMVPHRWMVTVYQRLEDPSDPVCSCFGPFLIKRVVPGIRLV